MTFNSKSFLFISAGGGVIALTVCAVVLTWNVRLGIQRGNAALENVREATADIKEYVHKQTDIVESDDYQKQLRATANIGNDVRSVVLSINKQLIPGIKSNLGTFELLQGDVRQNLKDLSLLTQHTDASINAQGGLLAEATSLISNFNLLATKFGLSVDELNAVIKTTADKLGISVDAFTKLLADPNLPKIIANLEKGTTDFAGMAANGKKATDELPQLFIDIRKMGDHANKFQKFVTVARILGLIAPFLVAF